MDNLSRQLDEKTLNQAEQMMLCTTEDEILAMFEGIRPGLAGLYKHSPHAAALGRAQALMHEMAAIIRRLTAENQALRASADGPLTEVAMVCTACRKPVTQSPAWTGWGHREEADDAACQTDPIMAMVAAGNEKIPFDMARPAMSVQIHD